MMAEARTEEVTDIEYLKKLYSFFLTSLYHMTKDDVDKVEEQLLSLNREMAAAMSLDELDAVMEQGFEQCGIHGVGNEAYSAPIRNADSWVSGSWMLQRSRTGSICNRLIL